MSKETIIYLVRHGQSEYNRDGIISGQVNPPLTDKGRQQIARTKQALQDVKFNAAYSSDLDRAIETAEIIYEMPVHKSRQLKNLRERSFGEVDGKSESLFEPMFTAQDPMSKDLRRHYKHFKDMESDHEVINRFIAELEALAKNHPSETILVGAHGTAIRLTLVELQELDYDAYPRGSINNGDYVKLSYKDGKLSVEQVVNLADVDGGAA